MNELSQDTLDNLLDQQKQTWLDGGRPSVDLLLKDSALPNDAELLLDLIYNEIVVREELNESPSLEEYVQRYPHLEEDLKLHFEVHQAVRENLVLDTRQKESSEPLLERESAEEFSPLLSAYEIVGELGRGGMGVVYKAREKRLKRLVALKMFQPGRTPSTRERARFRTEAEAIARLQHPNIVQIFEVGEEHGKPFLALELAEKGTLAQRLQELPFTPRAAATLISSLALAVQHAHEHQIIHRDLKPANVLFARDGTPKITDFGLAKLLEAEPHHDATRTGEPIGTPRYMSPEQAAGRPELIGPGTDVYALGTLLYECLTGQVPFVSASVVETIDKIRHEEPISPRRLQRSIPRDLETICLNCLQKEPSRRFASARDLADDLQRFLQGEPIQARRTPPWERAWMWGRRRPALATLLTVSLMLFLSAPIIYSVLHHQKQQRLSKLRSEVDLLTTQGQQALAKQEVQQAKESFLKALSIVKNEPALRDYELGVRGWFDQSMRDGEQLRWKLRRPPPLFEDRYHEALVQAVILDPHQPDSIASARQAIETACAMAELDDPSQRLARESLIVVAAHLILRSGDARSALAILDQTNGISKRWHLLRADSLTLLDRNQEAEQERNLSAKAATLDTDHFLGGIEHYHRRDFVHAVRDFDRVLIAEPDHFPSRLLQAACFLKLKQAGEAKIALTACIGQRPHFIWNYLLRGQAFQQLSEFGSAAQDYQHALDGKPNELAQDYLDESLISLGKSVEWLPKAAQDVFWNESIRTAIGIKPLLEIDHFLRIRKLENQ